MSSINPEASNIEIAKSIAITDGKTSTNKLNPSLHPLVNELYGFFFFIKDRNNAITTTPAISHKDNLDIIFYFSLAFYFDSKHQKVIQLCMQIMLI